MGARAEAADEAPDLEADLEKDLVISPPPPKTERKPAKEEKPAVERKSGAEKKAVTEKKVDKKKAGPAVKRVAPADLGNYAASPRAIQKVRPPVAQNPWSFPAGAYEGRPPQVQQYLTDEPRRAVNNGGRGVNGYSGAPNQGYNAADPRRFAAPPAAPDRIVRDGVPIRLAPAAAPPIQPEFVDESSGSDLLNSAAEIIGLPFAFISSLF